VFGEKDVHRVGQRPRQGGLHAALAERDPAPDLDHEREAGERQREREPGIAMK
jgi:hypothetical protein